MPRHDKPASPWRKPVPPPGAPTAPTAPARRDIELRLYGQNAIRAVFARRPDAIRKLYLAEAIVYRFLHPI